MSRLYHFSPQRVSVLYLLLIWSCLSSAQPPESFFPSQVGNLWQYRYDSGVFVSWGITRDSIDSESSRYLFGVDEIGSEYLRYKIDTLANVYDRDPWWDYRYKLAADSGAAWVWFNNGYINFYGWLFATTTYPVFGIPSKVKVFRFGPFHPDSGGNEWYYTEQHLASGFGLVFETGEPSYALFLRGCVVGGDTFGMIVSVPQVPRNLPYERVLRQNYPNPFNPSTTIRYELPRATHVTLTVYDVLGREVASLVDAFDQPGYKSVEWNAAAVASGVYFYRLQARQIDGGQAPMQSGQAGDFVATKKLLLVR